MRSSARCRKFLIWTQRPGSLGIIWNPELAVTHKHRHPEWFLPPPPPTRCQSLRSASGPGSSPRKPSCHLAINDPVAAVLSKPLPWGGAGRGPTLLPLYTRLMQPAFNRHHQGRNTLQQRAAAFPLPMQEACSHRGQTSDRPQHLIPPSWKCLS